MSREMVNSGIPWMGEIPKDWEIRKVKDVFVRKNEKAHQENPVILSLARSGIKVRDISTNEGQLAESYFDYNPVEPFDLLINPMDLYSGANCSMSSVTGVISPAYVNLRAKGDISPRYYDYYFKTQYWSMAFFAHGKGVSFDNRWTLGVDTLLRYNIPYPSIVKQHKIASFLDKKCGEIDEMIALQEQIIEELKVYKQSVITEVVTKGLNPDIQMKDSGIEWIGEIPEHWNTRRIGTLFRLRDEKNYKSMDEVQLLSLYTGIGVFPHGEQEERGNKAVTVEGYKVVHKNDIVVNIILAWMGAIGISDYDGVTSPAYDVYIPSTSVIPHYYHYVFRTKGIAGECYKYGRGIMMMRWRTYSSEFKQISIPFPSMEEQQEIADYLDEKCSEIDSLINIKLSKIDSLKEYKKSIIYEYVTGKKEVTE